MPCPLRSRVGRLDVSKRHVQHESTVHHIAAVTVLVQVGVIICAHPLLQGLQNAPLSGPSGAFSLVLQLDEERQIDTCELGSRAIWAPAQDPLSTFACPASFYSDVDLKLGIYTRRCLPCPQVPAFLPLPSPRLLCLLPVCDHDVFILPPTRVTRAPALDRERMYRQYSYSYF